ncbi:MAG: hypothetical protein KAH38_10180 [Candidatus Hydrogenedentes bacterium]|nr:hypothetical protein [Candidatus Hydrogenedentota bacterium]
MTEHFQDNFPFSDIPDSEGMFDAQMSLPIPAATWVDSVRYIIKRDGRREHFDKGKIATAIGQAANAVGKQDVEIADSIAAAVAIYIPKRLNGEPPTADQISDTVERVLIQMSHGEVALAYARYRDRRARIRRLRHGDMRVLLSELEEARHEREAATTMDSALRVRTSQDRIVDWDRNRIVEALEIETGLNPGLAMLVAVEVEKQIQDAGITALTTPLVRELVGAKLIEHGLLEENEQQRRLGVPLYDASHIIRGATPETVGRDPLHTDRALAWAVKKEYALTEVFSHQVTQAHLSGDFHLNDLAYVDRLYSGDHALAYLAIHGIRLPGGVRFANPPDHPETLLAQMVKYSDLLDALFSGSIGWYALNYMVAPFVDKLGDTELRRFSEMLICECVYRHGTLSEPCSPMGVSLFWNAPSDIAEVNAIVPGGGEGDSTYKQYELTARRLAWMLLDVFQNGGVNDADFSAPRFDIILDESVFNSFEGAEYLQHAAATALQRPNIRFLFSPTVSEVPQFLWRPRHVVWHRIALNMPRAAINGKDISGFFAELDRLCNLAIAAHVQKRDFIEVLLDPVGNAPLAALALEHDGQPYISSESGLFVVDVEGLYECAQIIHGTRVLVAKERLCFMEATLKHLNTVIERISRKKGLPCVVAANTNPIVGRRFATLDVALFPKLLEKIVKTENKTPALSYTSGVSLPSDNGMSPLTLARAEGVFHQLLGEPHFSRILLPLKNTSATALCDLLKILMRQTTCGGVSLEK